MVGLDGHCFAGCAGHCAGHWLFASVQRNAGAGPEQLFTSTWVLLMLAYAVRRLPYALRACVAALTQVHASLEEAAQSSGATQMRSIRRVVLPLMAGGILAGFMTSFMTAAVELSATILLSSAESQAPMSYGIYLYMQSIAGRGPGAALGIVAIAVVALGTYFSHRLLAHNDKRFEQRAAIQLSSLEH